MKLLKKLFFLGALVAAVSLFPGLSNGSQPRIVGGWDASIKKWPFLGAIIDRKLGSPYNGYFCMGALIHPRFVLTAAHCFDRVPARRLDLFFGQRDLRKRSNPGLGLLQKEFTLNG